MDLLCLSESFAAGLLGEEQPAAVPYRYGADLRQLGVDPGVSVQRRRPTSFPDLQPDLPGRMRPMDAEFRGHRQRRI